MMKPDPAPTRQNKGSGVRTGRARPASRDKSAEKTAKSQGICKDERGQAQPADRKRALRNR